MKRVLFLIANFWALTTNAQNYNIAFAGAGASTSVDTVKVMNLTSGATCTLNGLDMLHLTGLVGIDHIENNLSSEIKIFPNPMTDNSIIQIFPPVAGDVIITLFDMTGRQLSQTRSYFDNSLQEFRLSGINNGFYLINVNGKTYNYSGKLMCNAKEKGIIRLEKINNNKVTKEKPSQTKNKGVQAIVDMLYNNGDRLRIKGISGIYNTIITDIPTSDKTITFNFIACTDGASNNYPIVEIGSQVWMGENLKTTKYNDGAEIPNITATATWASLFTGAYCDYDNNQSNSVIYGKLYNWYAVDNNSATKVASNGGKNICPTGWHVPKDTEWTSLTTYLGGESIAGGKMKETGTTHWRTPNSYATNSSGYSGLPGGNRYFNGAFVNINDAGSWWSSTQADPDLGNYHYLHYGSNELGWYNNFKQIGFSVRCVQD